MTDLQTGEVLDDRFLIAELIGRGGMGSVFKATDLKTGDTAAIKIPFFNLESDPSFYSRFQREIAIGQTLDHPGIMKVLSVDNPSRPYLATEYFDGESLWDCLQRSRPLPVAEALRIALALCDALDYLTRHDVVHRDLKPTNVMLCRDGSVRIMDFGIAMSGSMRRLTLGGLTGRLGTPHYMAPEQVRGRRGDARSDVYSLGALLYEMTTGRAPYEEQPDLYSVMNARLVGDPVAPRVHNATISPQIEEIILHAMARDARARYPLAAAMRTDLYAPDQVTVTGRAARLAAPVLKDRRWRAARIVLIALIVPVLLFFVFLLMLKR